MCWRDTSGNAPRARPGAHPPARARCGGRCPCVARIRVSLVRGKPAQALFPIQWNAQNSRKRRETRLLAAPTELAPRPCWLRRFWRPARPAEVPAKIPLSDLLPPRTPPVPVHKKGHRGRSGTQNARNDNPRSSQSVREDPGVGPQLSACHKRTSPLCAFRLPVGAQRWQTRRRRSRRVRDPRP